VIAVLAASVVMSVAFVLLENVSPVVIVVDERMEADRNGKLLLVAVLGAALFLIPSCAMALAFYGILTRQFGSEYRDGETRCRKCAHILKGSSEPRCPECGVRR